MAATNKTPSSFRNRPRVGGAGFTIFTYAGQPLVFCQQVTHQSPQPVREPSAVHPMDEPYPAAIITPAAAGPGQMVLNMFELFGSGGKASKIWDRLGVGPSGSSVSNPFGTSSANNSSQYLNLNQKGKFKGFHNAADIVDIFIQQAQFAPEETNIVKYIRPLAVGGGAKAEPYFETYHECIITSVVDNEQIEVGTMEIIKQVSLMYRYVTRGTESAQEGFKFRNSKL